MAGNTPMLEGDGESASSAPGCADPYHWYDSFHGFSGAVVSRFLGLSPSEQQCILALLKSCVPTKPKLGRKRQRETSDTVSTVIE